MEAKRDGGHDDHDADAVWDEKWRRHPDVISMILQGHQILQ